MNKAQIEVLIDWLIAEKRIKELEAENKRLRDTIRLAHKALESNDD
mgnify:FL=1|tara:strand:- start:50 stop:187 length:138 start_codon:yes stop_codon:yes gene_type:complete